MQEFDYAKIENIKYLKKILEILSQALLIVLYRLYFLLNDLFVIDLIKIRNK